MLFDRADPLNPINRRISLLVMTKRAVEAALATDAPLAAALQNAAPVAETGDGTAQAESGAAPQRPAPASPPLASARS